MIHLDASRLPRYYQSLDADASVWAAKSKYKNLASAESTSVYGGEVRADFDPALSFFHDIQVSDSCLHMIMISADYNTVLQRLYGDSLNVFVDHYGGTVIGGLFNPALGEAREFKVNAGFSSKPASAVVAAEDGVEAKKVRILVIRFALFAIADFWFGRVVRLRSTRVQFLQRLSD